MKLALASPCMKPLTVLTPKDGWENGIKDWSKGVTVYISGNMYYVNNKDVYDEDSLEENVDVSNEVNDNVKER